MHLKRWITGLTALPILIFLIGFGPRSALYSMLAVVAVTALSEFYKTVHCTRFKVTSGLMYFLVLLFFFLITIHKFFLLPVIITLWAFIPMSIFMLTSPATSTEMTSDLAKLVFGPVYTCLPISMLIFIDQLPLGKTWIFFLLAVIFASDTCAFYSGRFFGKNKLHPKISPNKTWEGSVGGLLGSVFIAFFSITIIKEVFKFDLSHTTMELLILAAFLSVSGQVGDLAESMIKRNEDVKDSGNILPGHGGILDRIDGLLFSIPVLYMFLSIRMA